MPDRLNVRAGDTVTWVNRDIAPHTATAADNSWDTGTLRKGEQATLEVRPGMAADYVCRFHPAMKGTLKVG
jgi:plastocyanin